MALPLILHPEAQTEIAEAVAWYEEQRPGLGERFQGALDACMDRIQECPQAHTIMRGTVRRAMLRPFPTASSTTSNRTPSS